MRKVVFGAMMILGVLVVTLFSGCAARDVKPITPPAKVEDRAPTKPAEKPTTAEIRPVTPGAVTGDPLKDPRLRDPQNILSKRIIYYDFDSAQIKDEYKPLIQAHAKFLQENPSLRVTVEGHADERGSREYNLALGQRRADSVKRAMGVSGVAENRSETVSFGEEKPAADGSDEEAWSKNRRSVIVYPGE